ncbi:hypothetical protein H8356DRAFT_1333943 [Neocallimastix lanati (nom. inval.)]|nr:hypothetical protein H8356DRAFT_1333943 [Neocallimastix sp. JGI-2020a]
MNDIDYIFTKCFNCARTGHLAKECPNENRHNIKSRNLRIRKFGEVSYAQVAVDREERRKLEKSKPRGTKTKNRKRKMNNINNLIHSLDYVKI